MSDETKPADGPSEAKPVWVKDPQTGKVAPIWTPEDIHAARANHFVEATEAERDQAYQQRQQEGWKGQVAAGVAGAAEVVPFARNIARSVAPEFGADVDKSVETHPWIHGTTELAAVAATAGIGGETAAAGKAAEAGIGTVMERALPAVAEKTIIAEGVPGANRIALQAVEEALAKHGAAAAAEKGVASAVPKLSERVLGRLPEAAQNAKLGLAYSGIELTNEKDLGNTPEERASHIMGTLFWGAAGGVVGGELMHGLLKAASPVVGAAAKALGKGTEVLDNLAAAYKGGNGEAVIGKSKKALQEGLDAIDGLAKEKVIDRSMEAVRLKVGDEGMKPFDAQRIQVETAADDARANLLKVLGMNVQENGKAVRKISMDKVARALKSDQRDDVLEAMKAYHEAGKGLQAFHESLAQAGATGSEGLSGKVAEQMDGLLEVQDAMKEGVKQAAGKAAAGEVVDELMKGGIGGGIAAHFGHMLMGKAYVAAKIGKVAFNLAPAEFKAARLAQLARLSEGVSGHLDRVADAMHAGGAGKYAAPAVAAMSMADMRKLQEDVNAKVSNPQLALDHMHERAGIVNEFAPDTYAAMGLQYGQQLQVMQQLLQWPQPTGPMDPPWVLSPEELRKMSTSVAIVKDPRVFEAKLAKGTATPAEAKVYSAAHGSRAAALSASLAKGFKQGQREDAGTLKAMTGMMVMGVTPRASYSQPMLQSIQGMYSMRASQQGGPGSRGGTGGAKALTASQAISLPGQRVANRPVK